MVFVDTSFLVAAANPRERNHAEALALRESLLGRRLLTTNFVLGETWIVALRRIGHRGASAVVRGVTASSMFTIERPDPAAEKRAWAWLLKHDEREYSFVDATSFDTMRSRGIEEVLTFDGDFAAVGFRPLRA